MTEYIQDFKSKIDETSVRKDFPEITDTEIPVWQGNPSFLSMADKYILALLVFGLHILFFIAEQFDSPEGDGQLNAIVSLMRAIIDISGTMGFVLAVFFLAKINHYANFSTSGRWTTTWLIALVKHSAHSTLAPTGTVLRVTTPRQNKERTT